MIKRRINSRYFTVLYLGDCAIPLDASREWTSISSDCALTDYLLSRAEDVFVRMSSIDHQVDLVLCTNIKSGISTRDALIRVTVEIAPAEYSPARYFKQYV